MRKFTVVLAIGAVALLASLYTVAASAAPGNGATVINDTQCFTSPGFYTYCVSTKGTFNDTTTPSGNIHSGGNYTSSYSLIYDPSVCAGAACDFSQSSKNHYSALFKADGTIQQESGNRGKGSYTYGGQTCDYSYAFHYANGKVQYSDYTDSCYP